MPINPISVTIEISLEIYIIIPWESNQANRVSSLVPDGQELLENTTYTGAPKHDDDAVFGNQFGTELGFI